MLFFTVVFLVDTCRCISPDAHHHSSISTTELHVQCFSYDETDHARQIWRRWANTGTGTPKLSLAYVYTSYTYCNEKGCSKRTPTPHGTNNIGLVQFAFKLYRMALYAEELYMYKRSTTGLAISRDSDFMKGNPFVHQLGLVDEGIETSNTYRNL